MIASVPNRLGCFDNLMLLISHFWPINYPNTEIRYFEGVSLQSSQIVPLDALGKHKTCKRALAVLKSKILIFFARTVFTRTISFPMASKWTRSYAPLWVVFAYYFDQINNLSYVMINIV